MNCQKIKKLLNPYIDKMLDAESARQVEEHLKSCPACYQEYQGLQKIEKALGSFSLKTAPADFTQKIMTKISQEEIQMQTSWLDRIKRQVFIPDLSFSSLFLSLPSLFLSFLRLFLALPSLFLSFPRKRESIFPFRLAGITVTAALVIFLAFTFIFNTSDRPSICSAEVQFCLRINDSNELHTVAIAGDFNGWDPQANTLQDPDGDGIWTATLRLPPGRYEYMFVVNGEKWLPDPNAIHYVKDGFGSKNAILEINNCSNT